MGKVADKAAELSKSVESFCGSVVMFGTAMLSFTDQMPPNVGVIVIGVVGAFTTFRVWLVRNEKVIHDAVVSGEDLYEAVQDVWPVDVPQRGNDGYAYGVPIDPDPDAYGEHARQQ